MRWTESAVGGPDWDGPHFVPVPGLTHLTVVQGADGYVHFLGRRERAGADGAPSVDLVHAIQYQTGLAFTDWRSLGNPHEDREQGRRVAPPAGAAAQDGTVHVFVRGAHGGLMVRREAPSGKWRAWEDLGGGGLDARPAPIALSDGRIAVVSAAETGVFVWEQLQPGGDFTVPRGFGLHPVPGTLSAVETRPGRPTFFWADDAGATAAAWRVEAVGRCRSVAVRPAARMPFCGLLWTVSTVSSSPGGARTAARCSVSVARRTRRAGSGGTPSTGLVRVLRPWPGTVTDGWWWPCWASTVSR